MNVVGGMYESGMGTPRNLTKALELYQQAVENGSRDRDTLDAIERVKAAIADDPELGAAAAAAAEAQAAPGAAPAAGTAGAAADGQRPVKKARQDDRTLEQLRETVHYWWHVGTGAKARQDILAVRRTETTGFAAHRDAISAALASTQVDLCYCQPCARRIEPGQSVLLAECVHGICRACVPHMLQPDGKSIVCPVCQVTSTVASDAPTPHPLVEAELGRGSAARTYDCATCAFLPEDDRVPATVECTTCDPHKHLCEGHGVHHRTKAPTHTILPLPRGGATQRCPTHDQPITAHCLDCDTLICLACCASTHPAATHTMGLLTDPAFVNAVRAEVEEVATDARTDMQALIDDAADTIVAVGELDERDAAIRAEVNRSIDVLIARLERRRAELHEHWLEHSRKERAYMQNTREESEHRWRILASGVDVADRLVSGAHLGPDATIVLVQLQIATLDRFRFAFGPEPEGVPAPSILRCEIDEALADQLGTIGEIVQAAP